MKKIYILILLLGIAPWVASANTFSLQGVVPSAGASFQDFKMAGQADVGEDVVCSEPGNVAMNTSYELFSCDSSGTYKRVKGVWSQSGDNVFLTDPTADDTYVGIGTATPAFKLHLATDGSILAQGNLTDGPIPPDLGAGVRFMWVTNNASLRAGGVSGPDWDSGNYGQYSVGLGYDARAAGTYSSVLGGNNNEVQSEYSVISGGQNNLITDINTPDEHAVIAGGLNNTINQGASFIGGGDGNTIGNATGGYNSVIVGGRSNTIANTGILGVVVGGTNNSAGTLDFVGGGGNNTINSGLVGVGSTIVGGDGNSINVGVQGGFVGAGQSNNIAQAWGTISGGHHNQIAANGIGGVIGGGGWNIADGVLLFEGYPTIAGGRDNDMTADYGFIGGGFHNQVTGDYAVVVGGGNSTATSANEATGDYSFVGGGGNNVTSSTYASILGGQNNSASTTHSTVAGGSGNTASGDYAFVAGGSSNTSDGDYSWTGGQGANTADYSFVWCHTSQGGGACDVTDTNIAAFPTITTFAIRTAAPDTNYGLFVEGNSYVNGDVDVTGSVNQGFTPIDSDRRLKKDITHLDSSLAKLKQLNGVSYLWKKDKRELKHLRRPTKREIGVIAQEVNSVFPEVMFEKPNGNLAVDYVRLIAPLIEAVKELDQKTETLNARIIELESENSLLKERIHHFETK